MKWLFLVHQVRTTNSRERVRVWRSTRKVGAVLYRNSVYVLPFNKERLEDFQWLSQQIRDSRGEASVFVTESHDEKENKSIRLLFEERSNEEYALLLKSLKAMLVQAHQAKAGPPSASLIQKLMRGCKQLQEELAAIRGIDFFNHPLGAEATSALTELKKLTMAMEPRPQERVEMKVHSRKEYQRKTWSTREHIHIDRLCSAWLIRRFIDPAARFVFAPERKLPKGPIPFDVLGAEFGHHGDNCTFETLLRVFQLRDPALEAIAQIVHDVDLKDQKFGRAEAGGLDAIIRSLSDWFNDDRKTLEVGSVLLDSLYRHFAARNRT